jgi:hypothetical protein
VNEPNALVLRVAALKSVKDYVCDQYDDARAELDKAMNEGDRLTARSPLDGGKLGTVTKTEPKPSARVSDEQALVDWLAEHYPEALVVRYKVVASEEQLRRLLFEHAPELLSQYRRPDPEMVRELLANAANFGQPVGPSGEADVPGVVVETGPPVVRCNTTPQSLSAVLALIRAEQMGLDGVIRELASEVEQ